MPHHLLPYTIDYDFAPLAETVPGYLTKRGDWKALKEICGSGTWASGETIKVGVGDTGLSKKHIEQGDLEGAYAKDFTGSRSGWDDRQGHGSHVSCHIGAKQDDNGTVGIADDCQIVHAKVLGDSGSGSSAGILRGVQWLADEGCKVINLSLGGGNHNGHAARIYKELDEQGILVFAAMGNSGQGGERGGYPGRYPTTLGVTAVDYNKRLASFSSQSEDADLAGFGVQIRSCVANGRYARYSGTSMATPDQAGLATLLVGFFDRHGISIKGREHYIGLIKEAGGFEDLGRPGEDSFFGHGFIDVWKVISHYGKPAEKPSEPKPPTPPASDKTCGETIHDIDLGPLGKYAIIRVE